MNFKVRILTTIKYKEPDIVPIVSFITYSATINQILDKKSSNIVEKLKNL